MIAVALFGSAGQAADPAAGDAHPPGVNIGLPVGSAPPPGFYARLTTSYYNGDMVGRWGKPNGTSLETVSVTPALVWSTGLDVLGGQHYMLINQPIVSVTVRSPFGKVTRTGLFNMFVSPLTFSWTLAPGIFASAGSGVYLVNGNGGAGNDFYTFEQQAGFSYLRDGWNLSLYAAYDINTENARTHYATGDRLYLDFTATKKFGAIEIGPVGYLVEQATPDRNRGFAYGPAHPTFGYADRMALGGLIGTTFGPLQVQAFVTAEIRARSAAKGVRSWLSLSMPLSMDGPPPGAPPATMKPLP